MTIQNNCFLFYYILKCSLFLRSKLNLHSSLGITIFQKSFEHVDLKHTNVENSCVQYLF